MILLAVSHVIACKANRDPCQSHDTLGHPRSITTAVDTKAPIWDTITDSWQRKILGSQPDPFQLRDTAQSYIPFLPPSTIHFRFGLCTRALHDRSKYVDLCVRIVATTVTVVGHVMRSVDLSSWCFCLLNFVAPPPILASVMFFVSIVERRVHAPTIIPNPTHETLPYKTKS